MEKSIKKNYIFNTIYQLFTIIIPLITTPYISKVIFAEGVGKYSYTYSLVSYFIIASQLGFGYYAQREIAKYQGNKYQQSYIFYEILIVKCLTVILCGVVYIILCCVGTFGEYTNLMWWWLILLVAQAFDISFLFKGNEDFPKIVIRDFFIKILGIICIFLFVKSENDVSIYVVSIAGSNALGILLTWTYLPGYITKVNVRELHLKRHIIPTLKLFLPTIASMIYSYLDVTLIGVLINETYTERSVSVINGIQHTEVIVKRFADLENGYYEQAQKIVKVGMSVITALGTVMLPRNTQVFSSGNFFLLKKNIYLAAQYTLLIGIPLMFGLIGIADNLIPWFLGNDFSKSIIYLRMFAPLVILFGLENVFGIQYLMTTNQDSKYTFSILVGTIINALLNVVLIKLFWGAGAIISSVISEIIIVSIMYNFIHRDISILKIIKDSKKYLISGLIMFFVVFLLSKNLSPNILNTFIIILVGIIIYFSFLILFRDYMVMNLMRNVAFKVKRKI